MKLPAFLKTGTRTATKAKPKKLAATARRAVADEDYDDEPSMRLSSAFIVVLLLHVIAVGGIYAFNAVKERHSTAPEKTAALEPAAAKTAATPAVPANTPALAMGASAASYVAEKPKTGRETAGEAAHAGKAEQAPLHAVSTYTVAKGDNPVNIARRLHVAYDDLVKLNKIDDPRKLQIGQKLQVPAAKKTN